MQSLNILLLVLVIILAVVLGSVRGRYNQKALWTAIVLLSAVSLMGTLDPVFEHFTALQATPDQCNWRDPNKCIFRDYTKSGDQCSVNGEQPYSTSGLASYQNTDFKGWLQSLYSRNAGSNKATSEAPNVKEYVQRCRALPGFEFLKNFGVPEVDAEAVAQLPTNPAVAQQVALAPVQPSPNPGSTVNASDVKCRRILEQAPNPPFVKITGKAANTIENVQFIDNNNNMVESGMGTGGQDFSFQCPQGTDIVGYDMNPQGNERPDTSLFGGIGPVYCQDGTVVGKGVGKVKTTRMGQAPQTMLTKFNFVDSKTVPIDKTVMGYINSSNLENCANVCDMLKDNCGGFTYDNANKKCGLLYSVDNAKLQAGSNGRTYQKS